MPRRTTGAFLLLGAGLFALLFGMPLFEGEVSQGSVRFEAEPPLPPPGVILPEASELRSTSSEMEDQAEEPVGELTLPDGSTVATLNGVAQPALMRWKRGRPYSPIIGIRSRAGVDWYEHADHSFTTTVMIYRQDLGREDATTIVTHPVPEPKDLHR